MDKELRARLAPRLNARYRHLGELEELCTWAEELDWRYNTVHFLVLVSAVLQKLDDGLRQERGFTLAQITGFHEMFVALAQVSTFFDPERHRRIGIFLFLLIYGRQYVYKKRGLGG